MSHVLASLAILVIFVFLAMSPPGSAAPGKADDRLPTPGFPQSAGVQLKSHSFTAETLEKAHEMGFRTVRRGFYWHTIEKEKGVYDFSQWDKEMAKAKELGLTVVGVLFGNNKLYEDDPGRGGIQTEAGRSGFAKFAAACAKRYKDQNVLWEVWNEPNVRTFWRKDGKHNSEPFAQEYTDLVKAVMAEVLKADPEAFVMAGSVSNYWKPSYAWTEMCFQKGILDTGIRAWSVHPYGVRSPEAFAMGHEITRNLLKKYDHPDMPMLNTERGFAIKALKQRNNEGWSGGEIEQAAEYQAWHFVRQYIVDQLHGLPITIWYEWDGKDKWTGSAFALINPEPRPVVHAATTMFEQLTGYDLIRRIDTGHELDYVVLYGNEQGEQKLVVWTAPPPSETPDAAYPHQVRIEPGTSGAVRSVDVYGKPADVRREDGGILLAVSGAPQYVTIPRDSQIKARSVEPFRAPVRSANAPPENAVDLKLFEADDQWTFIRNTGEGLFEVNIMPEKNVGVLHYNFHNALSRRQTPYVLTSTEVDIPKEATDLLIYARSDTPQQLTFRLIDSTGQTHQSKAQIKGTEQWERVTIPLTRRLEHWGGKNDGQIHWPVKQLVFSVPQPNEDKKLGKVEYADVHAVMPAGDAAPQKLTETTNLELFKSDLVWQFYENTGQGSFELAEADDEPIGVVNYDFSEATGGGTPYVLAAATTHIPAGVSAITMKVRSSIEQPLTFRIKDSTGQTLQYKTKVAGTGRWEDVSIPLTRKLEHWGGANDGEAHFPLTRLVLSVPRPGKGHVKGKVEYKDVVATVE